MKKLLSLLCALSLLLAFAACGNAAPAASADPAPGAPADSAPAAAESAPTPAAEPAAGDITMRMAWWGSDSRHEATMKSIELYESQNPGVTIEGEYGGADGFKDKILTSVAGGNAPDVMQIDSPWLYDLVTQFDPFVDLSAYAEPFDVGLINDFGSVNGAVYGLPAGVNVMYMLMNTAVLDAAGVNHADRFTWETLITEGAKVHASNPEQYFLNLDQHSLEYHVLRPYLRQLTGGQLINEDGSLGFTAEQLTEAYTYIKRLFDEGVMQPAADSFMFIDAFYDNPIWVNNNVGADIDWVSMLTPRKAGFTDTAKVGAVPLREGATDSAVLMRPTQLLCVNKASQNPEEAVKFLNFFLTDPESVKILGLERSVPAVAAMRDLLNAEGMMDPQFVEAVDLATANLGSADNVLSANVQFETILIDGVEQIGYGQAEPADVAAETIELFNLKIEELQAMTN